jgi:excisionase family DNA binding protein
MGRPTSLLIHQAAELLGVSRRTVYYRIHEGRLQTIRTRCGSQRVLIESVEALLREMRISKSAVRAARDAASEAETPRL